MMLDGFESAITNVKRIPHDAARVRSSPLHPPALILVEIACSPPRWRPERYLQKAKVDLGPARNADTR